MSEGVGEWNSEEVSDDGIAFQSTVCIVYSI